MRTIGVEEEFLLVDESTGLPNPAAVQALEGSRLAVDSHQMEAEMQEEMLEVMSSPHTDLRELGADLREGRELADARAREAGARAVPLASSPLPVQPHTSRSPRYQQMLGRYGTTTRNSLSCGMHVHVGVDSDEEGVAVLDRIRVWLPTLLALSANSPFCLGEDTGHASYRYVSWLRWPQAGPNGIFGSADAYAELCRSMLATGVLLDKGMFYFDARLSSAHPTVEVRIADVCLRQSDALAIAGLVRGLVETAAREWAAGVPPLPTPVAVLRLASWRASLSGLRGELVDPVTGVAQPAGEVVRALLAHVGPALRDHGDLGLVTDLVHDLLLQGTGAERQRSVFERTGLLSEVVFDALQVSRESAGVLGG